MKIGITTFHWATNYGAILQAFALKSYLEKAGHEVQLINYRPKQYQKTLLSCFSTIRFWHYFSNVKDYIKEQKLEKFRKLYLNETNTYHSLAELKANPPVFDVYICGSDQVWNPFFLTRGEGVPTSSYFLDFGKQETKRIAYAVSMGCEVYPAEAAELAKPYVQHFDAISVREDSGLAIIKGFGYPNPVKLPDPTLLLKAKDYFFAKKEEHAQKQVLFYLLRNEFGQLQDYVSYFKESYKINFNDNSLNPFSLEEWISSIKNADFVVTNSFHGMVFSLLFHVPFVVIIAKGKFAGMNDRFKTLLGSLNLEERMMEDYEQVKLDALVKKEIDWTAVDQGIDKLRAQTDAFFKESLA